MAPHSRTRRCHHTSSTRRAFAVAVVGAGGHLVHVGDHLGRLSGGVETCCRAAQPRQGGTQLTVGAWDPPSLATPGSPRTIRR
jgi:hypothetical protein